MQETKILATLLHNAPLGIVLAIGGSLSYRAHVMLRQDRDLVVHTYQVLGTLQQMLVAVEEAEAAQRGFVITGEAAFLAPYTRAKDQVVPAMESDLGRLLTQNSGQRQRYERLHSEVEAKLREVQETVSVRQTQGFNAAQALIKNQVDRRLMNSIRSSIGEMDGVEQHLLMERAQHVEASERRTWWIAGLTATASISLRLFLLLRGARKKDDS